MKNSPTLIALSGYARSGKDEAAKALIARGWRRDAFADRLREFLYRLDPIIDCSHPFMPYRVAEVVDRHGWDKAKVEHPEIRSLLQRVGTDAGRHVLGENIWVDAVMKDFCAQCHDTVITDCRYPNEAYAVKQLGGVVIRINRPGVGPNTDADGNVHISDVALDAYDFDYTIDNDGTVEQLHMCVRLLADRHRSVA